MDEVDEDELPCMMMVYDNEGEEADDYDNDV